MKTYQEAIDWLYSTQMFGIKLGLDNVTKMLEECDLFSRLENRKILHVAGTNGKGSVCAFTNQILSDAGIIVGLFTSPHLIAFPERIRVNGANASEASIREKLSDIKQQVAEWETHPTFFEITLVVALLHFCESDCEVIVLETGMGGRLDATNALKAELSVITPIALDHQQWLGETIREIAAEKAGILKAEVPVIVAELHPDARDVVGRRALTLGIPYIEAHPLPDDWEIGLVGPHQRENAALAVEAACRLEDNKLTFEGIQQSLAATRWPGRFQEVGDRLVLDGAHNEAAAKVLANAWQDRYGETEKASLIFGAANSKDVVAIFTHLGLIVARIILVPIRSERRLSAEEMTAALSETEFSGLEIKSEESLASAINYTKQLPERALVAGSLFLVGEALALIEQGAFEVSEQ